MSVDECVPSEARTPVIIYRLMLHSQNPVRPAFRSAFKSRRCLIPADGFYEWKKVGNKKQPYHFQLANGQLLAFAGLWERWKEIESCTILTTAANELLGQFHDRMPVILSPNDYAEWLDPQAKEQGKLLTPFPASDMRPSPSIRSSTTRGMRGPSASNV